MNNRHAVLPLLAFVSISVLCNAGELLEDQLEAPVLVRLDTGQEASGFYMSTASNVFFVTAAHVFFDSTRTNLLASTCTLVSWTSGFHDTERLILKVDLATLLRDKQIKRASTQDVAVAKIGWLDKTGGFGSVTKYVTFTEKPATNAPIHFIPITMCQLSDEAKVGNEIYIFGYPSSLGMEKLPQLQHDRPLLRKGVLAGKNYSTKTLIVDAPVYYGNSGGPVIILNPEGIGGIQYRLIGIVSEFVPFEETWVNLKHGIKNFQISNSG